MIAHMLTLNHGSWCCSFHQHETVLVLLLHRNDLGVALLMQIPSICLYYQLNHFVSDPMFLAAVSEKTEQAVFVRLFRQVDPEGDVAVMLCRMDAGSDGLHTRQTYCVVQYDKVSALLSSDG